MAKEKKKKEPKVKLPNAWSSKKSKEGGSSSGKNLKLFGEDTWKAITTILIILVLAFILLGGVNQRKTVQWFVDLGHNIGESLNSWFNPENIDVTDDGVYYRPDGELVGRSSDAEETSETEIIEETINEE